MRRAWRVIELAVLPTIGLGIALVVAPGRAALAFHVWLLVVLAVALTLIQAVRRSATRAVGVRQPRGGQERPAERFASLEKLERAVSMATASDYDVHHRLRPVVREIASGQLLVTQGDRPRPPARGGTGSARRRGVGARPGRAPAAHRCSVAAWTRPEHVVAGLERV